jgi:hypothetical protein
MPFFLMTLFLTTFFLMTWQTSLRRDSDLDAQ